MHQRRRRVYRKRNCEEKHLKLGDGYSIYAHEKEFTKKKQKNGAGAAESKYNC